MKARWACLMSVIMLLIPAAQAGIKAGDVYKFEIRSSSRATIEGITTETYGEVIWVLKVNEVQGENISYTLYMPSFKMEGWLLRNESLVSVWGHAYDSDGNGYSESFNFGITAFFFVNPHWGEHEDGWDSSIDNIKNQACIERVEESSGGGYFYVRIELKVEDDLDDDEEMEKGTAIVILEAKYDDDGVLLSYKGSVQVSLEEGLTYESSLEIKRCKPIKILNFELPSLPPLSRLSLSEKLRELMPWLPFPIDYLYLLMAFIIGIIVGAIIRRRKKTEEPSLSGLPPA